MDDQVWLLLQTLLNLEETEESVFLNQLFHPKDRNKGIIVNIGHKNLGGSKVD